MSITIRAVEAGAKIINVNNKQAGGYQISPFPGCCGIKVLHHLSFSPQNIYVPHLVLAILRQTRAEEKARMLAIVDSPMRKGRGVTADIIDSIKKDKGGKYVVRSKFNFKNPITGNTLTYLCVDMIDTINNLEE